MNRKVMILIISTLVLILSVACASSSLLSQINGSNDSGNTTTSNNDSGNATTSNVLLQEDFSNNNSGWDVYDEGNYLANYEDGKYVVTNNDTQAYAWGFANKFFSDTSITVDTQLVSGPQDAESGIICRQDGDNFYYGLVSVDGYYGIFKSTADDFALIQMENMPYNDAIKQKNETNSIRFDCIGSTLSLYANGILLAQVSDSDYSGGDIGFIVGTYDEGGAKFSFDNLVVTNP